jgi:hypothetical protein
MIALWAAFSPIMRRRLQAEVDRSAPSARLSVLGFFA